MADLVLRVVEPSTMYCVHPAGGCFTNVSQALQDILSKCVYSRNHSSYENFTCTDFQLEILTITVISGIVYFLEIILESTQNVSETTPCIPVLTKLFLARVFVALQIPKIFSSKLHLKSTQFISTKLANCVLQLMATECFCNREKTTFEYWINGAAYIQVLWDLKLCNFWYSVGTNWNWQQ